MAAEVTVQNVTASAVAAAAVWDDLLRELPRRAAALNLPPPAIADLTLPKAMAESDLRMQLVTWTNRHVFGRAWVERLDELPRPVWVLDEGPAANGVRLKVSVALPDVSSDQSIAETYCVYDMTLTQSGDKVSGNYATAGVELKSLPVSAAKGPLQGTRTPVADDARRQPQLAEPKVTGTLQDLVEARKYMFGAGMMMRLVRAIDISLTQNPEPAAAWEAGAFVAPALPAGRQRGGAKAGGAEKSRTVAADDLLDREMEAGGGVSGHAGGAGRPEAKAPADAAAKAEIEMVRSLVERLTLAMKAWATSFPVARAAAPGAVESAADPDFGPWYGAGSLATNVSGANVLPGDAEARGSPLWMFVRNWRCVGPFPPRQATLASWNLPEFLDDPAGVYALDVAGLRSAGETNLPEAAQVSWQPIQEQIEEGLQKPWTQGKPGPFNGFCYARAEVVSPRDVDLWVAVNADDYGRLWVNERLVAAAMGSPAASGGEFQGSERSGWGIASFRKGTNVVVVRCDNATVFTGSGNNRRPDPRSRETFFWVKVAVRGKPLDQAAAQARLAAIAEKQKEIRHVPSNVAGYRNNNVGTYPDARPVTAWDLDTGMNVIWRTHLELESGGGYGSNVESSKAPVVILGDRIIVLGEPHFVFCLDKATGKVLWERECNVLEFTAPEKVEESRRRWAEYAKARSELQKLGRDYTEREAALMKRGMSKEEAKAEIGRVSGDVWAKRGSGKGKGGTDGYFDFMLQHGKFGVPGYGFWTGHSYASPVTDGTHVWVKFGTGVAACFDRDGNRRWMTRIPAEGGYSVCPSPVLAGRVFVVEVGARSERPGQGRFDWDFTRLIGLDAATGKELWRTEPLFHYTVTGSPVLMKATNGREEMDVVVTEGGVMVRAEDGKILSRIWLLDAGWGSPTVGDAELYQTADNGLLTALRPVMYDRDCAGLRRQWACPIPTGFDAGMAFSDGLLYGSGGGQGPGGYVVFDTIRRRTLRHEWLGHGDRSGVWRGIPPQSNGRQYVPIVVAGDYVFIGDHGSVFHGRVARGSLCGVVQKRWNGLLVGKSQVEKSWTGPPVFEGDRIYIRTDPSLVCIGYTGDEGRAYEADVNARYMLGDLESQAPEDTAPVEIAPRAPGRPAGDGEFTGFISYPMEVYGYFDVARADEVLAALGGPDKIGENVKEKWNDGSGVDVGGEKISRKYHGNCGIYGHHELGESAHFRNVASGKGAYFRATFANDRDRVVRVWAPQEPPDVWICGQRVPEGTRVRMKPGTYTLVARAFNTEEWPAAMGFYFRLDDSPDVKAERDRWQELLQASKPELERIARYGKRPAQVERAKKLLNAIGR